MLKCYFYIIFNVIFLSILVYPKNYSVVFFLSFNTILVGIKVNK